MYMSPGRTVNKSPTLPRPPLQQWRNLLTSLELHNFKAFEHLELEIKPLTLFLGPNNSGKSSILAAPKLLSQTAESFDANVPLLLNGVFGDYGTFRDIAYEHVGARPLQVSLSLAHQNEPVTTDSGVVSQSASRIKSSLNLTYRYKSKLKQTILSQLDITAGERCLLQTKYSNTLERPLITVLGGRRVPKALRPNLSRRLRLQHFLPQATFGLMNS